MLVACARVQVQVWDYLDDRLSADARNLVRAHTAECAGCADYFSFQERCRAALRALHEQKGAPWHVKARILDELIGEGYSPR
jgi:anti-sigma factor (TIGR02949 family)